MQFNEQLNDGFYLVRLSADEAMLSSYWVNLMYLKFTRLIDVYNFLFL
jgi:hypothetical protein